MDINAAATQIVDRHVFSYVTPLIKTLSEGQKYSDLHQDILEMSEKATALKEQNTVSFWAVSDLNEKDLLEFVKLWSAS